MIISKHHKSKEVFGDLERYLESEYNVPVILGAHELSLEDALPYVSGNVVFQSEPLYFGSPWCSNMDYLKVLQSASLVLDYSKENHNFYKNVVPRSKVLQFRKKQELSRFTPNKNKDIDYLFFGAINERRANILEKLISNGYNITALQYIWGDELKNMIERSKCIVNIHYHEYSKALEIARLIPLVHAGIPILSEWSYDNIEGGDIKFFSTSDLDHATGNPSGPVG